MDIVDTQNRKNFQTNAKLLLQAALDLEVPILFTGFSGDEEKTRQIWPVHHDESVLSIIWRQAMNPLEHKHIEESLRSLKRGCLVLAGMWSDNSVTFAALSALEIGFDDYVVADATRGTSADIHNTAMARMTQSGVVPISTHQLLHEWRRST